MKQEPRNILYVSHTADLRGSALSLRELMLNLDKPAWRAHALLSKRGPLEGILASARIPFAILAERGLFKLGRIRAALRYMRQHAIDLVHLNSAVPFCRDVGIAARIAGLPIVWHIREDPESKRVRRLAKWIRLLADKIIVVSSDLAAFFQSSGKVETVYNGIDLDRFSPAGDRGGWREKLGIDSKAFVFVMVGTIEERKGQHMALEVASQLVDLQREFHLIIVGSPLTQVDQERIDAVLTRYPEVAGITHCLGRQADVAPILRSSDCLILPSTWEGFPRTVAEAMACGLPVIVTRVGELPWMVDDGVAGFLVSPADRSALQEAMAQMLTKVDIGLMGRHAHKRARAWSTAAHVEKVSLIYDALLGQEPAPL